MISLDNQTHLSQKLQVGVLRPKSPSISFCLRRKNLFANFLFGFMHRIPDSPIVPKSAFILVPPDIQTFESQPLQVRFSVSKSQLKT